MFYDYDKDGDVNEFKHKISTFPKFHKKSQPSF